MPILPSPTEFRLLAIIQLASEQDGCPLTGLEIARVHFRSVGVRIPPGTLYTTLTRLVRDRALRYSRSTTGDKRRRFFSITEAGSVMTNHARKHFLALAKYDPRKDSSPG